MTDQPYGPFLPGKRRYRLIIQSKKPSASISTNNLKRFVKRLARAFGFKVLEIRDVTHGGSTP